MKYSLFDTVWMDLVFALHPFLLNLRGDADILSKRLQEIHPPVSKMQHCDWHHRASANKKRQVHYWRNRRSDCSSDHHSDCRVLNCCFSVRLQLGQWQLPNNMEIATRALQQLNLYYNYRVKVLNLASRQKKCEILENMKNPSYTWQKKYGVSVEPSRTSL